MTLLDGHTEQPTIEPEPDEPPKIGGTVAGPVFKKIAKEALVYRGVPPYKHQLAKTNL